MIKQQRKNVNCEFNTHGLHERGNRKGKKQTKIRLNVVHLCASKLRGMVCCMNEEVVGKER